MPNKLYEYTIIKDIYSDEMSASSIFLVNNEKNEILILKKIDKSKIFDKNKKEKIINEFKILVEMDHINIIKAYNYFEDDNAAYCIMEYIENSDYLENKILLNIEAVKSEIKIKSYIFDILNGLKYIHDKGYIHGDIKIENLVTKFDDTKIPRIKIIDFGLAKKLESGKFLVKDIFGTSAFIAPEIHKNCYINEKIDIYSAGILFYLICVSYTPSELGHKRGRGIIPFRNQDWDHRSKELIDLLKNMLIEKPEDRISITNALNHPFFK